MLLTMLFTTKYSLSGKSERPEALLLRIAAGDREALELLYAHTRVTVYALALSILKHPQDAQDVTQDAYIRIWEKAESYRPHGSAMGWILAVTRNLARMKLRDRKYAEDLTPEEWDALPAALPAVTAEDRLVLQAALCALDERERQLVLLHAVSGLKHREIASALDMPLPTVLSKYHRALKKLRMRLEGADACDE